VILIGDDSPPRGLGRPGTGTHLPGKSQRRRELCAVVLAILDQFSRTLESGLWMLVHIACGVLTLHGQSNRVISYGPGKFFHTMDLLSYALKQPLLHGVLSSGTNPSPVQGYRCWFGAHKQKPLLAIKCQSPIRMWSRGVLRSRMVYYKSDRRLVWLFAAVSEGRTSRSRTSRALNGKD
jgi:hypothetical protein